MRKPRDIDAELKALADKAKGLKARRVMQLGELVSISGADALDLETLAGALLAAVETAQAPDAKEAWRARGDGFFQRRDARRAAALRRATLATTRALARTSKTTGRAKARAARTDRRGWVMQRRERTRHLIELGSLVQQAGLVELTDENRATLPGGMLALADLLGNEGGEP